MGAALAPFAYRGKSGNHVARKGSATDCDRDSNEKKKLPQHYARIQRFLFLSELPFFFCPPKLSLGRWYI